jgi:hypothetical protein
MHTRRKITDKRLDEPLSPSTKTELLDHFREIRDLINALNSDEMRTDPSMVWRTIGRISSRVDEALEPGVASAAFSAALKAAV